MPVFLFEYGTQYHSIRVGFSGKRPLIYAIYRHDFDEQLPLVAGQTYKSVTRDQYQWIKQHISCNVSYILDLWDSFSSDIMCRDHGVHFCPPVDTSIYDLIDGFERQV